MSALSLRSSEPLAFESAGISACEGRNMEEDSLQASRAG